MIAYRCRMLIAVVILLVSGHVSAQEPTAVPAEPTRKYLELQQHDLAVRDIVALQFSDDGTRLAAATRDHKVTVWSLGEDGPGEKAPIQFTCDQGQVVRSLAFSPDAEMLATAAADSRIWVWDLRSSELVGSLDSAGSENAQLCFSAPVPRDVALMVADVDDVVRQYRVPTLQPLDEWPRAFLPGIRNLSARGRFALQIDKQTYRLSVWDLSSRSKLALDIPTCQDDLVAVTSDGQSLFLAGKDLAPDEDTTPEDSGGNQRIADSWATIDGGVWRFDTATGERFSFRSADDRQILKLFASAKTASQFVGLMYGDSSELFYRGSGEPIEPQLEVRAKEGSSYGPHVAISSNWPPHVARTRGDNTH